MSKRVGDPGYAAGWCVHYRSPHVVPEQPELETCEAGVPFSRWRPTTFGVRPCFLDEHGRSKAGALPCEHLRRPTDEEIAAHEDWVDRRSDLMRIVMLGIKPWRDTHRGTRASGVVECPACKGLLRLSIAASNGHIHGSCETAGCVSWME